MGLGAFLSSAGGGSLLGGIATGLFGRSSAKQTNEQTERLSSTAHQRATKDLRLAGLNPILSATGGMGSGASTPQLKDPGEAMVKGVATGASSALQAARMNQELKNLAATEDFTKEQTKAIKYGVPGKTLGTGTIDAALGVTRSNSAYALGGAASAYGASQLFKKGGKKIKAFKKAEIETKTKTKPKRGGWYNSRLNRSSPGKFNKFNKF